MRYFVYKITNLVNGKLYVGCTTRTIEYRWKKHVGSRKTSNFTIHKAFLKHGVENFRIELLEKCANYNHMLEREKYWISELDTLKSGYNMVPGGRGTGSGKQHPCYGKQLSEERKKKLSECMRGEKNPAYGKTPSHKTIQKRVDSNRKNLARKSSEMKGNAFHAKKWLVIAPDKQEHEVYNLAEFCRGLGFKPKNFTAAIARGFTYKGWFAKRLN